MKIDPRQLDFSRIWGPEAPELVLRIRIEANTSHSPHSNPCYLDRPRRPQRAKPEQFSFQFPSNINP